MSLDSLLAPLARVPMFHGLSAGQLRAILSAVERVVFEPGQTIIAEDAQADAAYVVVKGRADRISGHGLPSEPLVAGTMLGELAMLIETTYTTTVVAIETVRALRLSREALRAVMLDDPDIAAHFVEQLTGRMRQLADELRAIDTTLAGGSVPPRPVAQPLAS
jgi:CRP-like cAMP-binding protein